MSHHFETIAFVGICLGESNQIPLGFSAVVREADFANPSTAFGCVFLYVPFVSAHRVGCFYCLSKSGTRAVSLSPT